MNLKKILFMYAITNGLAYLEKLNRKDLNIKDNTEYNMKDNTEYIKDMQDSYFQMIYNKPILIHLSNVNAFNHYKLDPLEFIKDFVEDLYFHINYKN